VHVMLGVKNTPPWPAPVKLQPDGLLAVLGQLEVVTGCTRCNLKRRSREIGTTPAAL
jgi:hypothetical protein